MADYPLQTAFQLFLKKTGLAPITIRNYDHTITQLFSFLVTLHEDQVGADSVTSSDLRQYIDYLRAHHRLNDRTYNKLISQLNRYFTFCFTRGASQNLPTLELHGHAQPNQVQEQTAWLNKLPLILNDEQVHPYTKMTLLLCAHGYTSQEFLQTRFVDVLKTIDFGKPAEKQFIKSFNKFIAPIQTRQHCQDIFLKQRYDATHPQLTAPALHKYLQRDARYLGFSVNPQTLHRSYVLAVMRDHQKWTGQQLMTHLRLDPASLLYYRRLLLKND